MIPPGRFKFNRISIWEITGPNEKPGQNEVKREVVLLGIDANGVLI